VTLAVTGNTCLQLGFSWCHYDDGVSEASTADDRKSMGHTVG
jgi:hypothetical protein